MQAGHEVDQIGANDTSCVCRQDKLRSCVRHRGATTTNSDHAVLVWELSCSAVGHLNVLQVGMQQYSRSMSCSRCGYMCVEHGANCRKGTVYGVRRTVRMVGPRSGEALGHSQMRLLARSRTCINNISALSLCTFCTCLVFYLHGIIKYWAGRLEGGELVGEEEMEQRGFRASMMIPMLPFQPHSDRRKEENANKRFSSVFPGQYLQ